MGRKGENPVPRSSLLQNQTEKLTAQAKNLPAEICLFNAQNTRTYLAKQ